MTVTRTTYAQLKNRPEAAAFLRFAAKSLCFCDACLLLNPMQALFKFIHPVTAEKQLLGARGGTGVSSEGSRWTLQLSGRGNGINSAFARGHDADQWPERALDIRDIRAHQIKPVNHQPELLLRRHPRLDAMKSSINAAKSSLNITKSGGDRVREPINFPIQRPHGRLPLLDHVLST